MYVWREYQEVNSGVFDSSSWSWRVGKDRLNLREGGQVEGALAWVDSEPQLHGKRFREDMTTQDPYRDTCQWILGE